VHHELPKKLVTRLEQLAFVESARDLQVKYDEATRLFHKTVKNIKIKETEKALKNGD